MFDFLRNIWIGLFNTPKSEARKLGDALMSDPRIGRALVDVSSKHLGASKNDYIKVRINNKIYKIRELG